MIKNQYVRIITIIHSGSLEQRLWKGLEFWAQELCVQIRIERQKWETVDSASIVFLDLTAGEPPVSEKMAFLRMKDAYIIALCANAESAIDAYHWHPAACLISDFSYEDLRSVMNRSMSFCRIGFQCMEFPTGDEPLYMPLRHLEYAQARGKETLLHCFTENRLVKMNLGKLSELLPVPRFSRCHHAYLVSLPAVCSIEKQNIILHSREQIPVSRKFSKEFRQVLKDWRKNRESL